jgi:hypothetical protein
MVPDTSTSLVLANLPIKSKAGQVSRCILAVANNELDRLSLQWLQLRVSPPTESLECRMTVRPRRQSKEVQATV